MGSEWPTRPLSDLTDPDTPITYGVVKPGSDDPEGVRFIRGGDIAQGRVLTEQLRTITREVSEQYKRTQLRGGEIVVSLVGNPGQVAIVPDSLAGANIARQAGLVRLRGDVDTRFVKYFLSSPAGQEALGAHSLGSVQQVINLRDLKTVHVPTPPLSEQRAIAHALGTLDDKMELNRRMNETLEAIARAIFKSWFVDFDPVRAKLEGRDPGLPAEAADLFPDTLGDTELGEIPQGWRVGRIGELVGLSRESVNPAEFPDESFDHYSIPAYDETRAPIIEQGKAIKSNKFLLRDDRVLVSKLNPRISRVWLAHLESSRRAICSTEFLVALPNARVTISFLYCLFSSETFRRVFGTLVTGTSGSHQRVKPESLLQMEVVMAPPPVMRLFGQVARPFVGRIWNCLAESRTLAVLRDALLPRLISGELRLSEAERIVGQAT